MLTKICPKSTKFRWEITLEKSFSTQTLRGLPLRRVGKKPLQDFLLKYEAIWLEPDCNDSFIAIYIINIE